MPPPSNFITRITTHPVWLALSADIFTGQIIASLIVLTFVAVFLLREWIAQNARPGVFEEEEVLPPPDPAPVQPPEPQPQPQRRAMDADNFPEPDVLVQRQADAMQAVNAIQRRNVDPDVALNPDRWFQDDEEDPRRNIKKQKARKVDDNDGDGWRADQRRKLHGNHVQEVEDFRRKQFHRRIHVAKAVGAHRRNFYRPQKPHFPPPQRNVPVAAEGQQKFDFTFKPDQNGESSSKPQVPSSSHISSPPPSSTMPFTFNSANNTSPFPTVALQPPSSDIPFSLRSLQPESSMPSQSYPARPSLPTYTLGGSGSGSESPFPYSPAKTPVETPSLATYRAPEELGPIAGPSSSPPDYFELEQMEQQVEDEVVYDGHPNDDDEWDNVDSDENVDLEGEHDKYFREHEDVDIEVERERYLREVARDEDKEVPQQERVRIQLAVESESEDESDEGEGEEEIHDDGDHEDEEDNLHDEEEEDGQWQEEDEDAEVIPDGQAAQVAGAPRLADGLDEEDPGANLDPNDMPENVEDDMDGAMEGVCKVNFFRTAF